MDVLGQSAHTYHTLRIGCIASQQYCLPRGTEPLYVERALGDEVLEVLHRLCGAAQARRAASHGFILQQGNDVREVGQPEREGWEDRTRTGTRIRKGGGG